MIKRFGITLLIFALLNITLSSCYRSMAVLDEYDESLKVDKIILKTGEEIDFDRYKDNQAHYSDGEIIEFKNDGSIDKFNLDEIEKIYATQMDKSTTVVLVVGCVVIGFYLLVKAVFGGRSAGG